MDILWSNLYILFKVGRKFHPGISRWNLPVFPVMANKAVVANTGK